MKLSALAAGAAAAALLAAGSAQAGHIVNGSFETGNFAGWTQGGNTGFTFVACGGFDGMNASDGSCFAALGPVGSDGSLSQTFNDVVGKQYLASFDYASDGNTPNDFTPFLVGQLAGPFIVDDVQHGFEHFTGVFTGTGADTFMFTFRNDPGYNGLDNINVVALGTPEPATWAMMLIGIGGLGAVARRRRVTA
jgi:hypothetical protein